MFETTNQYNIIMNYWQKKNISQQMYETVM